MKYSSLIKTLLIVLMILHLPELAFAESAAGPFQNLVRKSFSEFYDVSFVVNKSGTHFEFCGDSSCDYFEWKGSENDENYWKFIVLYELNDAPGSDYVEFLSRVRAMKDSELINNKFCSIKGNDISNVNCNWESYAKSLKIAVGHSRYDEDGNRCYAKSIKKGFAELKKLRWKCSPIKPGENPFKD
jgi:hypothetical protein